MPHALPEPTETFDLTMTDGAVIRIRRHGKPGATRLFISHGNGFAVDAYWPFWGPLCDAFDVIVFDIRNHGQNEPTGADGHHYHQISRDLGTVHAQVTARLGPAKCVGVFHSMSGRAAMKHAAEVGWVWDALILFDPPNVPPQDHALYEKMAAFERRLVEFAMNRRERYDSVEECAAELREGKAASRWTEGAHALMAAATLRQENGDYVLSCQRELEASIYLAALTLDLWPPASVFAGPVKLIGADPEAKGPPTGVANQALAAEGGYVYQAIPGTGHMLQLEKPDACRAAMLDFLSEHGLV